MGFYYLDLQVISIIIPQSHHYASIHQKKASPLFRRNASVNKQGLQGEVLYETSCFLRLVICLAAR